MSFVIKRNSSPGHCFTELIFLFCYLAFGYFLVVRRNVFYCALLYRQARPKRVALVYSFYYIHFVACIVYCNIGFNINHIIYGSIVLSLLAILKTLIRQDGFLNVVLLYLYNSSISFEIININVFT